jgi:CPA2 family monovalent cation:H+ antiporter-2
VDSYQLFLGVSVLSMILAPFVIQAARPVGLWAERLSGGMPVVFRTHRAEAGPPLNDHVIVVGYGLSGRNLARVLRSAEIPYVILEQNGPVVRQAKLEREPILFGDATRHEVLERVGIHRARVIVFAISAPADERRGVAVARHLNPGIAIVVRTRYVREIEELERLGADQVIPEEFETSLEIFARVLRLYGIPTDAIRREIEAARGEHYEMLRGLKVPGLKLDALRHLGLQVAIETVELEAGTQAEGENPTTLSLRSRTGTSVIAVVRDGEARYTPDPAFRFRPGDLVVLVGTGDALAQATAFFRRPRDRRSGAIRMSVSVPVQEPDGAG